MECAELVELVTEYLEGALDAEKLERVLEHLTACDGCTAYVGQMRTVMHVLASAGDERQEFEEAPLLDLFRQWERDRPTS
ncbi:anti-sigma factor [Spongiactinospora rosea]|uniref:Anti-sigma factor n=1 Tax=Spongiactinospora rosea TaxID=2248750 RepID=A0A366LSL1_9ACTN|nr:zf-HC2 domain-containing protein [Spongiactinospora rosea]RBQ16908.1 anti-sigma factor [Spongiactinospora rosea]